MGSLLINKDGSNLIFVVGGPRSGTTWLHRLIASHPLISTGQESNLFLYYISPLLKRWRNEHAEFDERGPSGLCCYVKNEEFIEHVGAFARSLLSNIKVQEKGFVLEKTPAHVCSVKDILEVFPKSRIVVIHRHPFEVVPSLIKASQSWGKVWAPRNVRSASKMWRKYAKWTLAAIKENKPDRILELSFDKLREDAVASLAEVFEFIDVTTREGWNLLETESAYGHRTFTYYTLDTIEKVFSFCGFIAEKSYQIGKSRYLVVQKPEARHLEG